MILMRLAGVSGSGYTITDSNWQNSESLAQGKQFRDTRSGEFIHPTKGKLVTYLRQV